MKILITGINGFVGSNLVKYISKGHTIYGLDIVTPEKEGVVKTFSWDVLELEHIPALDAIIHLAGKAHDTKNNTLREDYFSINTCLTQKIYDYFIEKNIGKFVFFSTVKSASDRVVGEFLTEDVVPKPVGPYGESKIAAENYLLAHPARDNQKVYIFRPCMIHGPGNKGNLNLLYQVVRKGFPWPLGVFENRRSFASVDNVCFVVEKLLASTVESGIYHMADDEALSTNELINVMCETLGKKAWIWYIPKKVMVAAAKMGGLLHLPLNPERLQKLTENYVVSNKKLKNALGIEKMPMTAREGIKKTIQSFEN